VACCICQPTLRFSDFVRFAGAAIRLQLKSPRDGRRRFQGRLVGLGGEPGAERVLLAVATADSAARAPAVRGRRAKVRPANEQAGGEQTIQLPLADIEKARLVPQFDFTPTTQREPQRGAAGRASREQHAGGGQVPRGNEEGRQ